MPFFLVDLTIFESYSERREVCAWWAEGSALSRPVAQKNLILVIMFAASW
jgi:hypothetical protein